MIQDDIQSHHWSKECCKLHTLVAYYLGPDGSLQHDSLGFSSNDNNHYTRFLYQVRTMTVYYLKANHPYIIKNYSDNCGRQYKNYKSLWNCIFSRKHFFGISAEWVSASCDSIGRAVKVTCSQVKPPKFFE